MKYKHFKQALLFKVGSDKNSNNSSTPPSKEKIQDEVVRRTKTLRKTSGRKPGGQAGHKGCTLLKTDSPDSVENIIPNYCNECGNSLEDSELVMDYVTQVISLPEMKPIVKEIRHYVAICSKCGARIQSHVARKRGANAVVYDASVKSLVVYLSVVQFLPYGRIADFLLEVCNLSISEGSMVLTTVLAMAQSREISGTITDKNSKEAVSLLPRCNC